MTPVSHPLGEHLPTCSSPDNCLEYRALLSATPEQHARYLNHATARFASRRAASSRGMTAAAGTLATFAAPDPYAGDIAKLRREHPPSHRAYPTPPPTPAPVDWRNPYAADLQKLREEKK